MLTGAIVRVAHALPGMRRSRKLANDKNRWQQAGPVRRKLTGFSHSTE